MNAVKSYGIPGEAQETRTDLLLSAPYMEMRSDRPEPHYICQAPVAPQVLGCWVEPMPAYPKFYGNAKLDLFTPDEQLAVVTATMTDPVVKLMYDRLLGAAFLTYEDQETEQGLQLLVDKGLLTQERKVEIVALMQAR